MRSPVLMVFSAAMLVVGGTGFAVAQNSQGSGEQNPPHKSAPAQSSHAPGHDVQTGAPGTGETTAGQRTGGEATGSSIEHDNARIRDEAEKQQKK